MSNWVIGFRTYHPKIIVLISLGGTKLNELTCSVDNLHFFNLIEVCENWFGHQIIKPGYKKNMCNLYVTFVVYIYGWPGGTSSRVYKPHKLTHGCIVWVCQDVNGLCRSWFQCTNGDDESAASWELSFSSSKRENEYSLTC